MKPLLYAVLLLFPGLALAQQAPPQPTPPPTPAESASDNMLSSCLFQQKTALGQAYAIQAQFAAQKTLLDNANTANADNLKKLEDSLARVAELTKQVADLKAGADPKKVP